MKKRYIKKISLLVTLFVMMLFFQGCAVSSMPSEKMTFDPNKTQNGLIFGSITFPNEKAKYNGYFLGLICESTDEKTAKKNSTEIHFSPEQIIKMKHKGQLDNGLTYLFAIERPEGNYKLSGIRLFSNSGIPIMQKNSIVNSFSIPFKINKGEIQYVGNITFNEHEIESENVITYKKLFEKDLQGIKNIQPYIYWDGAKNDITMEISIKNRNF